MTTNEEYRYMISQMINRIVDNVSLQSIFAYTHHKFLDIDTFTPDPDVRKPSEIKGGLER